MTEESEVIKKFIAHLAHHLAGWRAKVDLDFAQESFDIELSALTSDPVYSKFHLATADYIFIRLMGRMSVSIGRRLGELYDKIPRLAAQARYGLTRDKVVLKFDGLELDVGLTLSELKVEDVEHLAEVCKRHLNIDIRRYSGIAIEIRYNFNPNDSARLRKDKHLANQLVHADYFPLYLVFAENSPRLKDAVTSLQRASWTFLIGTKGLHFMADMVGFDISQILDRPEISAEIQLRVDDFMSAIGNSYAYKKTRLSGI